VDPSYQEKIINFICDNYQVKRDKIDIDVHLIDDGIIDSSGIIELVCFLEEELGRSINDEDITVENFDSIRKIMKYIEAL